MCRIDDFRPPIDCCVEYEKSCGGKSSRRGKCVRWGGYIAVKGTIIESQEFNIEYIGENFIQPQNEYGSDSKALGKKLICLYSSRNRDMKFKSWLRLPFVSNLKIFLFCTSFFTPQ